MYLLGSKKMLMIAAFLFHGSEMLNRSGSDFPNAVVKHAISRLHDERKIFEHPQWKMCCHRVARTVVIIVTDNDYPTSLTFELLQKIHDVPEYLTTIVTECQNPRLIKSMYRTVNPTLVIIHEHIFL